MTTIVTPTPDYAPNEALTAPMTATEWAERFETEVLEIAYDRDECLREIAMQGDQEAKRLNLAHSPSGHYPPVVWELAYFRNR